MKISPQKAKKKRCKSHRKCFALMVFKFRRKRIWSVTKLVKLINRNFHLVDQFHVWFLVFSVDKPYSFISKLSSSLVDQFLEFYLRKPICIDRNTLSGSIPSMYEQWMLEIRKMTICTYKLVTLINLLIQRNTFLFTCLNSTNRRIILYITIANINRWL